MGLGTSVSAAGTASEAELEHVCTWLSNTAHPSHSSPVRYECGHFRSSREWSRAEFSCGQLVSLGTTSSRAAHAASVAGSPASFGLDNSHRMDTPRLLIHSPVGGQTSFLHPGCNGRAGASPLRQF